MKKTITFFLLIGFFSCLLPVDGMNFMQYSNKSEFQDKQELKVQKKKTTKKQVKDLNAEKQAKELKKKDIEAKEHSVNRNMKVKRVSVDENLPETVRQRNIP